MAEFTCPMSGRKINTDAFYYREPAISTAQLSAAETQAKWLEAELFLTRTMVEHLVTKLDSALNHMQILTDEVERLHKATHTDCHKNCGWLESIAMSREEIAEIEFLLKPTPLPQGVPNHQGGV